MLKIAPNLRIFIAGKTQSGKTFLSKFLTAKFSNRLIYDIKRQYADLGFVVHSIDELRAACASGRSKITYQPVDISVDHFNDVCKFIFYNLRNIMFVVEEVHKFASKHKIPEFFNSLVTICEGDPYFIGVLCISQRPANVHNDIISSCSIIICFKLNLPSDADAIIGIDKEIILNLQRYFFAVFDDREHDNPVSIHDPI